MWAEAAKWLNTFDEAVLTFPDADGYPASVRVGTPGFDAATGRLPVPLSETLRPAEGRAGLLCHSHDEKLWNLKMLQVKGELRSEDGSWVFVTTEFTPPSKLAMVDFIRNARSSAQKYLDKRGLPRPEVNWAQIKEIQRRVKG